MPVAVANAEMLLLATLAYAFLLTFLEPFYDPNKMRLLCNILFSVKVELKNLPVHPLAR